MFSLNRVVVTLFAAGIVLSGALLAPGHTGGERADPLAILDRIMAMYGSIAALWNALVLERDKVTYSDGLPTPIAFTDMVRPEDSISGLEDAAAQVNQLTGYGEGPYGGLDRIAERSAGAFDSQAGERAGHNRGGLLLR